MTTSIFQYLVAKEKWIDKLRYKNVKLTQDIDKSKENKTILSSERIKIASIKHQKKTEGRLPKIGKLAKFQGDPWEEKERMPINHGWRILKKITSKNECEE